MTDIDSLPFLTIGEDQVSLKQSLGYLQAFGRFRPLLQEIVTHHFLFQEIQKRDDLNISSAEFEQAVIEFRLQQKLTNPDDFQNRLSQEGMNYATFQNRVLLGLKLDKLRTQISAPKLEEYFLKQKYLLEQLDLNCLIFDEQELATNIKNQIIEETTTLEQVVQEHSLMNNPQIKIMRGLTRRQELAPEIIKALESAKIGELLGLVEMSNKWCLFRIEEVIPATLDKKIQKQIENQILQEWLAEKMQNLPINLTLNL
ncbi:Chaperone SurA (plasmid) [Dolichospermum sp. UHCC 0315A]|uniref:peptidylprolyl isomerase n=1 Tax=Dolichospermum sp. UHCC 0315A TaxID=1914871 RepID=UPI0011E76F43|nr:peptidylprolyl isomerase [Dolichospermum sp. UHCC 0315A]QEI44321.1 Chaperone SurA [Dolichospermum sp. UHCC 0315A]QEI44378.1 Chaperone SurA [Dolichospermum sp. UHCC 0315A]